MGARVPLQRYMGFVETPCRLGEGRSFVLEGRWGRTVPAAISSLDAPHRLAVFQGVGGGEPEVAEALDVRIVVATCIVLGVRPEQGIHCIGIRGRAELVE